MPAARAAVSRSGAVRRSAASRRQPRHASERWRGAAGAAETSARRAHLTEARWRPVQPPPQPSWLADLLRDFPGCRARRWSRLLILLAGRCSLRCACALAAALVRAAASSPPAVLCVPADARISAAARAATDLPGRRADPGVGRAGCRRARIFASPQPRPRRSGPSPARRDSAEGVRFKAALTRDATRSTSPRARPRPPPKQALNSTAVLPTSSQTLHPAHTHAAPGARPHPAARTDSRPFVPKVRRDHELSASSTCRCTSRSSISSPKYFLPNINLIAPNSITLLETNQKFIESYMVGLNHEMARELLWREYPTDQRGSYFRQFWDVSGYLPRRARISRR